MPLKPGHERHDRNSAAMFRERTRRPGPPQLCGECGGHGDAEVWVETDTGPWPEIRDCPTCHGAGVLNEC
jgi:DnaJ-class molecular chaperone